LIKQQLLYVPVVGMVCWLLNFPRLERKEGSSARQRDIARIKRMSENLIRADAFCMMVFVEGTRYTMQKASLHAELLPAKAGGLIAMLEVFGYQTPILDVTLYYPVADPNFWDCLSGRIKTIEVELHQVFPQDNVREWLNALWQRKADRLESYYKTIKQRGNG
jgi:1-acyl-sn-glycerol-3-phosphate acyltransferase